MATVAFVLPVCTVPALARQRPDAAVVAPYSAVLVLDGDAAMPGGGTLRTHRTMFVARDGAGRFLYTEPAPEPAAADPGPRTIICDPGKHTRITLDARTHHAVVVHMLLGLPAAEPPLNLPQLPPPAGYAMATSTGGALQDLGTKTIDGILAGGTLMVLHNIYQGGTEPGNFTRTTEEWRSVAGGILLEETVHDQRGMDAHVHVDNLRLAPPPESLFLVPDGYSVTDIGETRQLRDHLLAEARSSAGTLTGLAQAQAYLAIASAESLVIGLPDQFTLDPTPDQRHLAAMAAADAVAAFRAAASAQADGDGAAAPVSFSGQTKRDAIEENAIMIAGEESPRDQRAQLLREIIAGAGRTDPPRASIYSAILQYWYGNPPSGAPAAADLIRQCAQADGSFPYFGLVAALRSSARNPIAPGERNALVQMAYHSAASEATNAPAYGWAAMALGELHTLAPGLDPQLADTLAAMLNRPDALRLLHFQTEEQLFNLLQRVDPARAQQITASAGAPPPLTPPSHPAPVPPRGQPVVTPDDSGQMNDFLARAQSLTATQPQQAVQAARSAESLLLGDLASIASSSEPIWIGPAAQLVEEFQHLDMYDEAAALEGKVFAAMAADVSLIQLSPAGLPNLPGPGTTIQDELLDLTAALCRLDTGAAIASAEAMPDWFKPLALATIVQHAATM